MSTPTEVSANEDDVRKNALPDWLDKLQNESWQAEILISGGAFVGLASVNTAIIPLFQFLFYSTFFSENLINRAAMAVNLMVWSLMLGFLIHLVLRGFWIGLVGMNYAFPKGIDNGRLAMKGKFKTMFREAQNTSLIISLDKYCGAIFAVTFVWLFSCIGIVIYATGLILMTDESMRVNHPWVDILSAIVVFIGLITLIDFMSAGRLRRIKWLAVIYYPVHKVMSFVTLSFIYRRLYYTIASNMHWRYAALLFSMPIFLFLAMVELSNISSNLLDSFMDVHGGYDTPTNTSFLNIKDQIIYEDFLEVKLNHIARLEEEAFVEWKKKNPTNRAANFGDLQAKEQLAILSELYQLEVDEKKIDDSSTWMIYQPRNTAGPLFPKIKLITVLDISNLKEGGHQLTATIKLDTSILSGQKDFNGHYARVNFYLHKAKL